METVVLNNGIKCILHSMPNTHSVTIGLYIKAGVGYTEPTHGITHLLEHLHFRQLGGTTQNELYYRMESIGSTLRAVTYRDMLSFSMKVAPCYFNAAMGIFNDLINAIEWTQDSLRKEKQVVLNQIWECGDYISIEEETRYCVFKNHPLADNIMGSIEDVESIELSEIINYKKEIFNANGVLFCVTGNYTTTDIEDMKEKLQSCRLSENKAPVLQYPACFHSRRPTIILKHTNDNSPLDVNISFDINLKNKNSSLLTILNCILGEGVGSRLQRRIREQKCYSANIRSYIEWYRSFAVLHICFSVEKNNLYASINDVLFVLQDLKRNIRREDLDVSLPFYTINQMFYEDDTEEMNFKAAYHYLLFGDADQESIIPNDMATCDKLQIIAREIFEEKNCCVVVVGNTKGLYKKTIRRMWGQGQGDGSLVT